MSILQVAYPGNKPVKIFRWIVKQMFDDGLYQNFLSLSSDSQGNHVIEFQEIPLKKMKSYLEMRHGFRGYRLKEYSV